MKKQSESSIILCPYLESEGEEDEEEEEEEYQPKKGKLDEYEIEKTEEICVQSSQINVSYFMVSLLFLVSMSFVNFIPFYFVQSEEDNSNENDQ